MPFIGKTKFRFLKKTIKNKQIAEFDQQSHEKPKRNLRFPVDDLTENG